MPMLPEPGRRLDRMLSGEVDQTSSHRPIELVVVDRR